MTYLKQRKAVAPVIATLLLVAIAVVGGSLVFSFSQDFFSTAQISGVTSVEFLKISGYDATDGPFLDVHDGLLSGAVQGSQNNDGLLDTERIAIYLQNNSVQKVTLSEVRFAGTVYSFVPHTTDSLADDWSMVSGDLWEAGIIAPSYGVATNSNGVLGGESRATMLATTSAEILPGKQVTIILQLDENIKLGRDAQIKLTTGNGAVFVGTVIAGQTSG